MQIKYRRKTSKLRTALTAAAIIAGGVITGTLLALTPLLDETSAITLPRLHQTTDLRGTAHIGPPRTAFTPHHEPQPHLLHGVHTAARAYQSPGVNL